MSWESHERLIAQFLLWKESVIEGLPKAKLVHSAISSWSPGEYLLSLDGTTRLAVILSLAICSYILFASMWRFSRALLSLFVFAVQLVLVFLVVLVAMQYREALSRLVDLLAQKLDL